MSSPFLGQIQAWALNFAPRGWAMCNGQLLPISQYTALFSLLGTFYGGNGTSNFALPDLRSRVPLKFGTDTSGNTYGLGEAAGEEGITLVSGQLPLHAHSFVGTTDTADDKEPIAGSALGTSNKGDFYYAQDTNTLQPLNVNSLSVVGSGQSHTNLQEYLAINWCIAMSGIYPARN